MMISPIINVSRNLKTFQYNIKNQNSSLKPANTQNNKYYSAWAKGAGKISFGHYVNYYRPSFDETIEENYFKLPKIKTADGSDFQCMPDENQIECAKKIYEGDNVIYVAPTGTGKTALAHYAINLNSDKKTIYTTPFIALANDKYREFKNLYGEKNVGILTGDNKINPNAPILIMITEIYNNQLNSMRGDSKNIGTVIFDEAHMLGDKERGTIWESSIINTPDDIQMLCLSATIKNAKEINDWIQFLNPAKKAALVEVPSDERYVPLVYYIYNPKKQKDKFLPIINKKVNYDKIDVNNLKPRQKRAFEILYKSKNNIDGIVNISDEDYKQTAQEFIYITKPENDSYIDISELYSKLTQIYPLSEIDKKVFLELLADGETKEINPIHIETIRDDFPALVEDLEKEGMLPALIFKLSIDQCEKIAERLKEKHVDLTTDDEKEQIDKILNEYKENGIYLGRSFDEKMIKSGFAFHNSGVLPQYKKLVEDLFSKKLLKVVIATSTLSAGINMPAKTVVISDTAYRKFDPDEEEIENYQISSSEFHQMSGRAGRRGIDQLGNVVLYNLDTPRNPAQDNADAPVNERMLENRKITEEEKPDELAIAYQLLNSEANEIRSHYKPQWHLLAQYWDENTTKDNIAHEIALTSKIFLSKNKEKEIKRLTAKFENYTNVLLKLGYLTKNYKNEFEITPKGKLLKYCQGLNPIMLSHLIYEEHLKDLDLDELCQFVGIIAGATVQKEDDATAELIKKQLKKKLPIGDNKPEIIARQYALNKIIKQDEEEIIRRLNESRLPSEDIMVSNTFPQFVSFLWPHLNDANPDNISNFKNITAPISSNNEKADETDAIKQYNRYVQEGNVFKILSKGVTILKQISKICDYAISRPDLYPNGDYYKELRENSQLALMLMRKDPIYDEDSV